MILIAIILYYWSLISAENKMQNPTTLMNEVSRQSECGNKTLQTVQTYTVLLGSFLKQ